MRAWGRRVHMYFTAPVTLSVRVGGGDGLDEMHTIAKKRI